MPRIKKEKHIVQLMIELYCHKKEGNTKLCNKCNELIEYSHKKLNACKFGENKSSCKNCPIHCYNPHMKELIHKVMRYSGPRMFFQYPIITLRHLIKK